MSLLDFSATSAGEHGTRWSDILSDIYETSRHVTSRHVAIKTNNSNSIRFDSIRS